MNALRAETPHQVKFALKSFADLTVFHMTRRNHKHKVRAKKKKQNKKKWCTAHTN